ncbi:MAG: hypothetical protein VZR53_15770 [Prevotella sp.]|nr:hypothetical protein [Prevotella sp.]
MTKKEAKLFLELIKAENAKMLAEIDRINYETSLIPIKRWNVNSISLP